MDLGTLDGDCYDYAPTNYAVVVTLVYSAINESNVSSVVANGIDRFITFVVYSVAIFILFPDHEIFDDHQMGIGRRP